MGARNSQLKRPSNAERFFFEGRELTNYLKGITDKPIASNIEDLTAIGQKYMAEVKALPVFDIENVGHKIQKGGSRLAEPPL